jgi:transcriptional regulator with XRE-family HTH domain
MDNNKISARLRELRTMKGVSQDTVAESCEISRVGLARYETGQRVPVVKIASRLAEYYGVSVEYLLGKDSAEPQEKAPTPDDARAEAKMLLEGMDDEQYQAALQYLKFLNNQK